MSATPVADTETAVVGAGIAGLAVAFRLARAGRRVVVLEAGAQPGGVIRSEMWEGCVVEGGPNSFLTTPELLTLVSDAGAEAEMVEAAPAAKKRYVVRSGRLMAVPTNPMALLTSPLLSLRGKLRLLLEPLVHGSPPKAGDESFRDFVVRHFGREAYTWLAAPFVSGVYAGDPERLSARAAFPMLARAEAEHGSVIVGLMRGAKKRPSGGGGRLRSVGFRGGNAALPRILAERLGAAVRLATPVERIVRDGSRLRLELADGAPVTADRVVLATPAAAAARLVASLSPELTAVLGELRTAPVAVVHTLLDASHLLRPLDGFGFLVPRGEGLKVLGTLWTSSIFPDRAPPGTALLTSFAGGSLDPEAVRLPEKDLLAIVDREHRGLGLYQGEPLAMRRYPAAAWIAQYDRGQIDRVARAEALAAPLGLSLAGSSYRGVSVGDCVREAFTVAAV